MHKQSFTACSIQKALDKVRLSLGTDAVILSTETHRELSSENVLQRMVTVQACRPEVQQLNKQDTAESHSPSFETMEQLTAAKSYIEQLYQQEQQTLESEHQQHLNDRRECPENFAPEGVVESLMNSGMSLQQVRILLRAIPEGVPEKQVPTAIENQLKQLITSTTLDFTATGRSRTKPLIVVFAGRSGAGKSTLVTKLATQCELREELPVAVIEFTGPNRQQHFWVHLQMQSLGIRTAQVANATELQESLRQFSDCAAVLIDTPAISANPQQTALINAVIHDIHADHCILTHDVHTRPQTTIALAKGLSKNCPLMLALTKTDQEKSLGHLVSLFQQIQIPVTLLSHSPALADGFTHVSKPVHTRLIQQIMGLKPTSQGTVEPEIECNIEANKNHVQDSFTLNFNPM